MREKVKWNVGMVLRRVERGRDISVRVGVIMKGWRQGYMEVEGGVAWKVFSYGDVEIGQEGERLEEWQVCGPINKLLSGRWQIGEWHDTETNWHNQIYEDEHSLKGVCVRACLCVCAWHAEDKSPNHHTHMEKERGVGEGRGCEKWEWKGRKRKNQWAADGAGRGNENEWEKVKVCVHLCMCVCGWEGVHRP